MTKEELIALRDRLAEEHTDAHPYLEGLDGSDLDNAFAAGFDALLPITLKLAAALEKIDKGGDPCEYGSRASRQDMVAWAREALLKLNQ